MYLSPQFRSWLLKYPPFLNDKVRLEFYDRLENLCEYDYPMTPELRKGLLAWTGIGTELYYLIEQYGDLTVIRPKDFIKERFRSLIPSQFYLEFIRLFDRDCVSPFPLVLTFDDIGNTPVADPNNVDDWNALMGTEYTRVEVSGAVVSLFGAPDVIIGANSFRDNLGILTVEDQSTEVVRIESAAFYGCTNLTSVIFPSVIFINGEAFYLCTSLVTVDIPLCEQVGDSGFAGATSITSIDMPVCHTVGSFAFSSCTSMTDYNLPNALITGTGTFYNNASLVTMSLPSLTLLGAIALSDCDMLETVNLPVCTDMLSGALSGCNVLTTVNAPELINVGDNAISSCPLLVTLSLPSAITLGQQALANNDLLENPNLPLVQSVGDNCFQENEACTTIELPSCTTFGDNVFEYNVPCNLTDMIFPSMTTIGSGIFTGITGETITLTIPTAMALNAQIIQFQIDNTVTLILV